MTGTARPCPVCSGSDSGRKFLARDHHYGIAGEWWVRECRGCASYFLEQPPAPHELAAMYGSDYYSYSVAPRAPMKDLLKRVLLYSRDTREPEFPRPGRVLDFGCGAGEFLLTMRARGWECAGVEVNAVARERAAAHGLDVRAAVTGPDGFPPGSFDYVRANHSLEHVPSPGDTLRELRDALKPGGTLFIGVPTTTSENARLFGPCWWHVTAPLHTFVPSTNGIVRLVERTGLRVLRVGTNGDFAGTAGSLQIALNRRNGRPSSQGAVFTLKPLLLLGHWYGRLQDVRGVGDKLELTATKPVDGDGKSEWS